MTTLVDIAPSVPAQHPLTRETLLGRVAALYLSRRLAEEPAQDGGTARFIIDLLTPAQTAAIARAILDDPALRPKFEIHLPAGFVSGFGLPQDVLTPERATFYRNAPSDRPALLLANTGDDEEQSLRDLTSVSAADLQSVPELWVQVAAQTLPLAEDHRKWWIRALAALQDLRFVSLDRYAAYVLRAYEEVEESGHPIIHALGAALPALRLPRDLCYFEALPAPFRTHTSRWKTLFSAIYTKRACYLSKQTPSGTVIGEDDLRVAYARVRESIPDAVRPAVEAFVESPAGWTAESAQLAEQEWESILPLFDGMKREKFNLGQATLDFFDEGDPDILSDSDREYLKSLIKRKTSGAGLPEDQAFYDAHRDEMRENRKLKAAWDRFILGTPRESADFLSGLLVALEGFPWETPARRRTLTIRGDRRFKRDLRDLNVDAGMFFALRYRGLPQLFGRAVQWDLGDLLNYADVVRGWREKGESLNRSEAKAALQLKFSLELEIETTAGTTETVYQSQFIWRFDPLAVSCEFAADWSRLVEHPLVYCRVGREPLSGKGRSQSLDLFNVRTLRAAYGQERGSFVAAYKPPLDLEKDWRSRLAQARGLGLLTAGGEQQIGEAFDRFAEAYRQAITDFWTDGVSASSVGAQLREYGTLLDALCRIALGDRGRELLLRPILSIGTVETEGGAPATIVAPWHPQRIAAMRQKARRVAKLIRQLVDGQEARFADPRLFFREAVADLAHPVAPEVVLGWRGEKAELLATTEVAGDYSLCELPVAGPGDSETNENPSDAAAKVAELVDRYLALHPHEQANLSVVLYNCDSSGLPTAVVGRLAALGDADEGTRCQVILRHRDAKRLRRLYEEIVDASNGDGDALVASETTRDFMARLRIGIMADQAPAPDPRDGCPEDIVFSQDVIARHASLGWYPIDAVPLDDDALGPAHWSRRRPAAVGDMRSVVFLCCPAQPASGWAYLTAIATFLLGDWDGNERQRLLPARQLDFRDPVTARIVEETHNLGSWVANYDELLDRRQLLEQNVRVIRYKQSPSPGRNLIVSSRAPLGLLRSMLIARLRALNLGMAEGEFRLLAERFIDAANSLSGDIVLRAAKRGRSASELIGLVLSQMLIAAELASPSGLFAWFFLDDYADWLGAREEQIADLLVLAPTVQPDGSLLLRVVVVESKYVDAASLAAKRKESERQLRSTLRRLAGALQGEVPTLDREVWLARLSDLLIEGTRLPAAGGPDLGSFRRAVRNGTCPVELRGYSHVFVSTPAEAGEPSACVHIEEPGEDRYVAFQELFSRERVRDLVQSFASEADPTPIRREGGSAAWADPTARRPATWMSPTAPASGNTAAAVSAAASDEAHVPVIGEQLSAADLSSQRGDETGSEGTTAPAPAAGLDGGSPTPRLGFLDRDEPEPPADAKAVEWLRSVEMAARGALQQFQLQAKLLSATLTPNVALLKFQGSSNLTVDQVLRRRTEFLTTHGLQLIGVQPEPGAVCLSIARPERQVVTLRSTWRRWSPPEPGSGGNQRLLVGIREDDGSPLVLAPGDEHAPHTLIAGSTGSGKSVLMQNLIVSIAATNTPSEARIILIDPKQGVDYFAFENLPHLSGGIIDRQEAALERIHWLVEEMDARYTRLREARATNLRAFNARVSVEDRMPVIWLVHDEFAEWMLAEDYKGEVAAAVGRLGVKARAAGIHLIFAAQRPEAAVMPMQLRANLGNRLVLRVDSEGTSEIALGEKGADRLLGRGHLMAKMEGSPGTVYAQVPFASPEELEVIVAAIQAG